MARSIEEHAQSCTRCAARIGTARSLTAALASVPAVFAPAGVFQKVMDGVYRQALTPAPAAGTGVAGATGGGTSAARFYRKLGLSLVLTAGVLGMSLLIPRATYTALVGTGGSVVVSRESTSVVKSALDGAGSTVRGILGESPRGGDDR
jgi:anti-sigma factor RsiW